MPTLHLLGTGAALADPERTTTMLAFQDGDSLLVVDCGGDVVQRLLAAGLTLSQIDALVITHEHPDHVSGFPLLIEKLWLDGRERPLPVHGPQAAVNQARRLWEAFETGSWKQVPPIEWNVVPLEEGVELLRSDAWRVTASPGEHSVPVMGIRVESARGGGTVAYSADTGPADAIRRLARGADILVHEAGGAYEGHTTAADAARIAREAEVGRLLLVHLPPGTGEGTLRDATENFPATELGTDGARFNL